MSCGLSAMIYSPPFSSNAEDHEAHRDVPGGPDCMKRLFGIVALAVATLDATAEQQVFVAPKARVENVRFEQLNTGLIQITYDLASDDGNAVFAISLEVSNDGGRTWTEEEQRAIAFDKDDDAALKRVWQLVPDPHDDRVVWAGGEPDWAAALAIPGVKLNLYGKAEASPGRKMGHLSVTAATADAAEAIVHDARRALVRT